MRDADLVLVATPVGQMPEVMATIAPALGSRHGRHRRRQHQAGRDRATRERFLGEHFERFVPAHPIAGTEKSGAAAAFAELYRDRNVILTPLPETSAAARRSSCAARGKRAARA